MNYNFISEFGEIKLGGCGLYTHYNLFYLKFKVGSIVYSRPKALKGIVEKIVIKKIRLFQQSLQKQIRNPAIEFSTIEDSFRYPPLYIDTLNGYHNEEDLCSSEEVVQIIDNYLSRKKEILEGLNMQC